MPKRCALGCTIKPEVSYHKFPNLERNPDRFKAWVRIVGGKLETPADYEYYRKKVICDIHFRDCDKNRNNRLNFMADPTLHVKGKFTADPQETSSSQTTELDIHDDDSDNTGPITSKALTVSSEDTSFKKPTPVQDPPKQVLQLRLINENVCDEPVYEVLSENENRKKQIATQTVVHEEMLPTQDCKINEKVQPKTKIIPSQKTTPVKEKKTEELLNENNKEYWKLKIKNILHNTHFCGLCLNNGVEMISLNDHLEIVFNEKTHNKILGDIVTKVFKEDEYCLANSQICNKCAKELMKSYLFIIKTEDTLKTLNRYLNELYDKTCYIRNNSLNDANVVQSIFNVVIALDNKAIEQIDNPEIKIEWDNDQNENEPILALNEKSSSAIQKFQSNSVIPSTSKQIQSINRTQSSNAIPQIPPRAIKPTQTINRTRSVNQIKTIKHSTYYRPMFNKQTNRCEICLQSYKTNYDLAKHYNQHLKPTCTFCHKTVKDGQMLAHLERWHQHLIHLCSVCNIVFYCRKDLDTHVAESHFTSVKKCVTCLKSLSSDRSEHKQCKYKCTECMKQPCVHHKYIMCYREQVSNFGPRAKCLDCPYVCTTVETLIAHVNKIHLKRTPHRCKNCKKNSSVNMI